MSPASDTAAGTPAGTCRTCDAVVYGPLLNTYCTSNCHGVDHARSGQTGFQLDIYESTGSVKGAMEMAPRIEVRAARFKDMPPVGEPMPTEEERKLIGSWAAGGAPFCTDGGVSPDGGVSTDGQKFTFIPDTTVPVYDEAVALQILRLCDSLEEDDDVQNVYSNLDIPDELLAKLPV